MRDIFSGITGQDQVVSYLQRVYESKTPTHAYLIAGGEQQDAADIAFRFAAGIIAGDDDEAHDEALRRVHPDLHLYSPGGAASYLVEQVRELTHDAELAPIRAARKVYVVQDAHLLSGAPANAFLKTLEEPPENVVCILTARSEASVLDTLKSRCEVLSLNASSRSERANSQVMDMMIMLTRGCGNAELLSSAKRLVAMANDEAQQNADEGVDVEAYIEKYDDYLTQGAKRHIEQQGKREATARERAALLGFLSSIRTWLRDCLVAQSGATGLLAYPDYAGESSRVAARASAQGIMSALGAVNTAASRISYNVTPQLAVEAMFLEIREALCRR